MVAFRGSGERLSPCTKLRNGLMIANCRGRILTFTTKKGTTCGALIRVNGSRRNCDKLKVIESN